MKTERVCNQVEKGKNPPPCCFSMKRQERQQMNFVVPANYGFQHLDFCSCSEKDENEDCDEKMLLTASTFAVGGSKRALMEQKKQRERWRERGREDKIWERTSSQASCYASLKLRLTHWLTDLLTRVKCRATSVAKKLFGETLGMQQLQTRMTLVYSSSISKSSWQRRVLGRDLWE